MDIHEARTKAIQEEIKVKMDAHQERMEANKNAWRKEKTAYRKVTKACLERKEPTLEDMTNIAAHPEKSNEEAAVETIGALEDRYGARHLATGRCLQP
jgi:hypothetical protein